MFNVPYCLSVSKVTWLTQDTGERTERRKEAPCQGHILLRVLQQQKFSGIHSPPSQADNVGVQIDTETTIVQYKVHFGFETPTSTLAVFLEASHLKLKKLKTWNSG